MADERKDPFQTIIDEAIREAERVPCDIEAFREGLRTMLIAVKDRLECES